MSKPWIRIALGAAAASGVLWAAKAVKGEINKNSRHEQENCIDEVVTESADSGIPSCPHERQRHLDELRNELAEKQHKLRLRLAAWGRQKQQAAVEVLGHFLEVYGRLPEQAVVSDDLDTPEPLFFSRAVLANLHNEVQAWQRLGFALNASGADAQHESSCAHTAIDTSLQQRAWVALGALDVRDDMLGGVENMEALVRSLGACEANLEILHLPDIVQPLDDEAAFAENTMEHAKLLLRVSISDFLLNRAEGSLEHCRRTTLDLEQVIEGQGAEVAASNLEARFAIRSARYLIGWLHCPIMDRNGMPTDSDDWGWMLFLMPRMTDVLDRMDACMTTARHE